MSSTIIAYVSIFLFFILGVYTWVFFYLHSKVKKIENSVVDVFLEKIAKIPALIEVMRPYVVDEKKHFNLWFDCIPRQ
jgi:ABC-type methionine transport system permease subunit